MSKVLQQGGLNRLDGLPERVPASAGSSGSNLCVVPECVLPGGHLGHHEDSGGNKFLYDNYDGRRAVVAEETESSESEDEKGPSSSTTSEAELEELIRDGELPNAEPAQQAP